MKKITQSAAIALLCATLTCNAFADGPRGYYPQHQQRGHYGRSHDSNWIAPLLFLGLAGAVIGSAAASQQSAPPPPPQPVYVAPPVTYVQPAPVYTAPPPVAVPAPAPQPANNAWYFCRSVGQYYPYTQHCPEGWQVVSPTPQ